MSSGFSHVGIATTDMNATVHFYKDVLGFRQVVHEVTRVEQGGTLRQAYFDIGEDQYIVFMEPKGVPGINSDFDAGINRALGLPLGMYHFAFKVSSLEVLAARRQALADHGVEVSDIIDLDTAKSVFLFDPNGIQIEFSCHVRPFNEADLRRENEARMALPTESSAD